MTSSDEPSLSELYGAVLHDLALKRAAQRAKRRKAALDHAGKKSRRGKHKKGGGTI